MLHRMLGVCDLSVIADCVRRCADSCCERPFQMAHQKDKMKKKKEKHLVWQNWHRYRWSFFGLFPWIIADELVWCRQCDKYTNLSEFPWNAGILKRNWKNMVPNDSQTIRNWDNDEHGDRFSRFPFFCTKDIFLHIVNDINFHGEHNAYINKAFCHVPAHFQ